MDTRELLIGTITNNDGSVYSTSDPQLTNGVYRVCDDFVGNRDGFNNLAIDSKTTSGGLLSGTHYDAYFDTTRTYNAYPVAAIGQVVPNPNNDYFIDATKLNEYALKCLQRSTPERSEVNVPAFLGELKDFPDLIRDAGRRILKGRANARAGIRNDLTASDITRGVAQANLGWRWGLAPLVNDLRELLNFQQSAQNRFDDLDRLRKGVKLGRKVKLDSAKKTWSSSRFFVHTIDAFFDGYWDNHQTNEVWATVQWYCPSWSPVRNLDDAELKLRAKRMVAGMSKKGAAEALWELLPWSWLADWFSNAGDALSAASNSTDFQYKGLCVMQHTTHRRILRTNPLHWVDGHHHFDLSLDLEQHRELKLRFANVTALAFPTLRLPIINAGKLSILGSLSVLRLKK